MEECCRTASVKFERQPDGRTTLLIGPDDFPFPYPLVTQDGRWRFDAKQGNTEVLDRRIGRNELGAIDVAAHQHAALARGVYLAPSAFEAGFMSAAHGDAEIDLTLERLDDALAHSA